MRSVEPTVFLLDGWTRVRPVLHAITAQEHLERLGTMYRTASPDMDPADRNLLERVYHAAVEQRDAVAARCPEHELGVFYVWQTASPTVRMYLKSRLVGRLQPEAQ